MTAKQLTTTFLSLSLVPFHTKLNSHLGSKYR